MPLFVLLTTKAWKGWADGATITALRWLQPLLRPMWICTTGQREVALGTREHQGSKESKETTSGHDKGPSK